MSNHMIVNAIVRNNDGIVIGAFLQRHDAAAFLKTLTPGYAAACSVEFPEHRYVSLDAAAYQIERG